KDDLDLLLSLDDHVMETPPGSPSCISFLPPPRKYFSQDMSVFRDYVQDCLDYDPKASRVSQEAKPHKSSDSIEVDKFSGLRIQNPEISRVELSNHLSDIRFIRLPTIKDLPIRDLSGIWATIGVLVGIGAPKTSSIGKPFMVWKISCLDDEIISLFLFGEAYQKCSREKVGTVFALFNSSARKDKSGKGVCLSIYSGKHILKIGAAADMGFCPAEGPCNEVINKRSGKYCRLHKNASSRQYSSTRTELRGGNFNGFRDHLRSEGIYVVPSKELQGKKTKSAMKPVKLLSVDALKKALSNGHKVTTNNHSQGMRFLSHVTGGK
ncbi:hypothetical protein M569_00472, partial [Genlisea aurea]